jgi:hypothetical protein
MMRTGCISACSRTEETAKDRERDARKVAGFCKRNGLSVVAVFRTLGYKVREGPYANTGLDAG